MKINKEQLIGALIVAVGGTIIIASEFLEWTDGNNALSLYDLSHFDSQYYIYLFPLLSGILIIITSIGFVQNSRIIRKISYLLVIIAMNLMLFYIAEIFETHGNYVWNYEGIYAFLIGISVFLLGLLYSLIENQKDSEKSMEKQ